MKRLAWLVLFLFFSIPLFSADQPDFPNIYIDAGCAGTKVGSQANPYDDLADINWTTGGDNSIFDYLAGSPSQSPTVYTNKGDTWRELLTIGCSGIATYPIIITSYGSGAKPIINAADVLASWTPILGWSEIWTGLSQSAATAWSDESNSNDTNDRIWIKNAYITSDATTIRIKFKAHSTQNGIIDACAIGEKGDGNGEDLFDYETGETPVNVQQDSSDNFTIVAGASEYTDSISISISASKDYLVAYKATGTFYYSKLWFSGETNDYLKYESEDETENTNVTGYTGQANLRFIEAIEEQLITAYSKAVATEPNVVVYDGTILTENDGATTGVGLNEWDWDSNTLYVNVGEDPSTGTLEAGQRNYCITMSGKNYIIVDGVHAKYSNHAGQGSINCDTGQNATIQNSTITGSGGSAIRFGGHQNGVADGNTLSYCYKGILLANDSQNCTVKNNTISNTTESGIFCYKGGGDTYSCSGITVQSNTITNSGHYAIDISYGFSGQVLLEGNSIDTTGTGAVDKNAIGVLECSGTIIVRYNIVTGANASGGTTAANGIASDTNSDNMQIYYNISYGNQGCGVGVWQASGVKIYNNVCYDNGNSGSVDFRGGIRLAGSGGGNSIVKNNIVLNCYRNIYVENTATSGFVSDNNLYYDDSGTKFHWSGTDYDFADWRTNSSQDANSLIPADPKFINPGSADFTLQSNSPCIDAGVDVGLTRDYEGNLVGSSRAGVILRVIKRVIISPINHQDIGAYEYHH